MDLRQGDVLSNLTPTTPAAIEHVNTEKGALDVPSETCGPTLIAPGTPTHEHVSEDMLQDELEARFSEGVSGAACQADLSSAALLLASKLCRQSEDDGGQVAAGGRRAKKRVFEKGNYNRYYGYRLGQGETQDSRLKILEKKWFANRRCLDLGCNAGILTLSVVQQFLPAKMVGVDIDEDLTKMASQNLRGVRNTMNEEIKGKISPSRQRILSAQIASLANTWFQQGDLLKSGFKAGELDTIMCMSVTKWIHMHEGDAFMKRLFRRVRDLLSYGGYFVLEPQPWSSYKSATRKLKVQNLEYVPLASISFRPEQFPEYLTKELGFRLVHSSENPSEQPGFRRPIYCFKRMDHGTQ